MSSEALGRKRLEDLVNRKYPGDRNNQRLMDSVSDGGASYDQIAEMSDAELEELVEMERQYITR